MDTNESPWVRVVVVVRHDNAVNPDVFPRVDTITGDQADAAARVRHLGEVAAAAGHPLPDLAASQTAWVVPLPADIIKLIRDLTDADPCWYDHNGNCAGHGHPDPCPHGRAQALLKLADETDRTEPT